MGYIAVIKYDSSSKVCQVIQLTDDFNPTKSTVVPFEDLGKFTIGGSLTPINFSVDRTGSVKMDCGDFQRFSKLGSAVVLAELKTRSGRTLGYKLLSCSQTVVTNLKTADIVSRDNSYGENEHFIQNGIIRNNTVNCYPRHPYPSVTIEGNKKSKNPIKKAKEAVKKQPKDSEPTRKGFNETQRIELERCRSNGVDPKLIQNPNLNQQQMRVLWVSKSKGALAEEFNDPRLSSDAMKFYADRLYDKKTVEDCKPMLDHPELGTDELSELYQCVCDGIDYSDLIGKSATDISTAREMATRKYWGSSDLFNTDYYQKALNVAMKTKGF
jgi:hypothetical protein